MSALGFKTDDLPISQLFALDDALRTLMEVVAGLREQPRFSEYGNGEGGYSEAGWLLDDFRDRIATEVGAIRTIVQARPVTTPEDAQRKFYLLARDYFSGTDRPEVTIAEFSRIAREMGGPAMSACPTSRTADLREIENLIAAHVNAVVEFERQDRLNDWGLSGSDDTVSEALGAADLLLLELCKARPTSPEDIELRRLYLSAEVPSAIENISGGFQQEVIDALIGGGAS